jgi:CRP/FNR family transcriptional regulator
MQKRNSNTCLDCEQHCAGLQGFRKEDVELLDPNKTQIKYAASEVIIKQGALMDFVYFLKSGLVKVVIESDVNRNIILEIASPQRYIGISAINISSASPVSYVALTDCQLCQIRKQPLFKILLQNESFNHKILTSNGNEYLFMFEKLAIFGSRNNHGRLANTLLYLNSPVFKDWDIYSIISRKELAELSAMSIESMNKILKEFKEDLLVEVDDKRIKIRHPELLERLSRVG